MSGQRPPARSAFAAALVLLLASTRAASSAPAAATPAKPDAPGAPRTTELPNGLRVVLAPDSAAAALDVSVWYDAGLRAEKRGQHGLAHLFEHLMFDGSTHVARRGHQARIDALGGRAGAVTTADGICFFETVPASGLDTALELEADRMTGLTLDATRFNGERAAVRVERQQPASNSPLLVGLRLITETAYGEHPYHSPVMGSDDELAKLTLADAQLWYRTHYGPRRAVLTIAGRFDPDEALRLVHHRFDALRGGEVAAAVAKPVPGTAERRRWMRTVLPFRLLVTAWTGPARDDPDRAPLTLLAALLTHGDEARLQHELIGEKRLCFFLEGDLDARRDASLMTFVAGVQSDADSAAVEQALVRAVEGVASAPPTAEELTAARRQIENGILFGWQSSRGRAQAIGSAVAMGGSATDPERDLARLRSCTAADVQRAAARWLIAPRRSVLWLAARPADGSDANGGGR